MGTDSLHQAGRWFLESGIQETNGGVSRYYCVEPGANLPVSSEITGYAASALTYFYERTGNQEFLDGAVRCARFLAGPAWDNASHTYPFEPGSDRSYFFDTGIIARGLMAVSRATGEKEFERRAHEAALSLGFDFLGDSFFYPVISLPMKEPLPEEPRWSRKPGCFQLKSALIWREIGDEHGDRMFNVALAMALASHQTFLSEEQQQERVMDRLHAYCYFLEALMAATEHPQAREALAWGIGKAGFLLRKIRPVFERSDVNAQLLRVRLMAHHWGLVPIDESSAAEEAEHVAQFQDHSTQTRLAGGFWFGRKGDAMLPFSNPVSTAFCAQALALWDDHKRGQWHFSLAQLI